VIIDCFHCNARPATAKVKKQLSRLHMYMREAARGDVSKLCQHTRELLNKLYAARETTTVLLPNLLGALALAPNEEFHLWLQSPMIIKATCDETLDLLGSDPNNERVKGRSNYVYLLCFW
jgi:sarcosine oxidase delta subunit